MGCFTYNFILRKDSAPSYLLIVRYEDSENIDTEDERRDRRDEALTGRGYTESLNVTKSYGTLTDWGVAEGIRELLQNLWDGAVQNTKFGGDIWPNDIRVDESKKRIYRAGASGFEPDIIFDGYSLNNP